MNPEDVPDQMIVTARDAANRAPQKRDGKPTRMRHALAAVWPEIEKRVREQVAAEIEARVAELLTEAARRDEGDRADRLEAIGWYAKADHLGEGARIARGESR